MKFRVLNKVNNLINWKVLMDLRAFIKTMMLQCKKFY